MIFRGKLLFEIARLFFIVGVVSNVDTIFNSTVRIGFVATDIADWFRNESGHWRRDFFKRGFGIIRRRIMMVWHFLVSCLFSICPLVENLMHGPAFCAYTSSVAQHKNFVKRLGMG